MGRWMATGRGLAVAVRVVANVPAQPPAGRWGGMLCRTQTWSRIAAVPHG